jgi:hypothetical protein
VHAQSGYTTHRCSQDVKQNPSVSKGLRRRRAGLVTLRRSKAGLECAAVGGEKRRHMIELAAYYRAERRGFVPGGELQDWLDAEREIGARLASSEPTYFEESVSAANGPPG